MTSKTGSDNMAFAAADSTNNDDKYRPKCVFVAESYMNDLFMACTRESYYTERAKQSNKLR